MLQILIIENRDLVHAQTFCTRVGNEGVKHKFNKFEEQKNEIIKSVVLILVLKKKKKSVSGKPQTTKAKEGLPTSDFRLPISDFRLATSNFRLLTSDFRPDSSVGPNCCSIRHVGINA